MIDLAKFEEKVRRCEYLAEDELKILCEFVSIIANGTPVLFTLYLLPPAC